MADLRIDVAAEFSGKKAFKDADKATASLNNTVGKLAKTLGLAFGAQALVRYSKQSIKAFAADEAAATRLANAVDNLGLSFFKIDIEKFIKSTETSAGILDDVLRPSMQALLTTTGSLTKSQELLTNAIQISRASGVDLATVSQDLANGYVGITRGLKKYNTGLTQAELKSKSFNEILGVMLAKSAGAADAYLTTTAYKFDVLNVAAANAQETIGAGLVDAFAKIGGGTSASDAAKTIDSIAKSVNALTAALAFAVNGLTKLYKGLDFLTSFGGLTGANGKLTKIFEPTVSTNRSKSPAGTAARTKQQRDAEAAAAKRAKELAALTKKQVTGQKALTAEQKKQAALKKAGTVFDLEQINILAALKGKISEEDKVRLQAQLALLNGNADLATKLTNQILAAQDSSGNLAKFLSALPNARNPFEYLDGYLTFLAGKASALTGNTAPATVNGTTSPTPPSVPSTNLPTIPSDGMITYNQQTGLNYNPNAGNTLNVVVNADTLVGNAEAIAAEIQNVLQNRSLSGSPSQIGRLLGSFG